LTSTREIMLRRIREALVGESREGGDSASFSRAYRTRGRHEPGAAELVDLLEDRTLDYRAGFLRATPASLAEQVASALGAAGRRGARLLIPPGLEREWLSRADAEVVVDHQGLGAVALDGMDAVVTACAVAIAETGTIVLDGSPDQGRRAITLVPDVHVCVVSSHQIVETVPEALARLAPRRPTTFISGPSATSDIELNRVEGVHGPRRLVVIVVSDPPAVAVPGDI
jgi:L-lactate dehydrogenase complex protein LldG